MSFLEKANPVIYSMTELDKTKLLFTGIGLFCGWMIGGLANIVWFFYSIQSLGYGENAPEWYVSIRSMIRPAVLILFMSIGYIIGQWNFSRAVARGRFK